MQLTVLQRTLGHLIFFFFKPCLFSLEQCHKMKNKVSATATLNFLPLNTKSLLQSSYSEGTSLLARKYKILRVCSNICKLWTVTLIVSFSIAQHLKNDLMRQFDSQVNDFMDSLIEESASLESAPLPAVFSPPLSDKERSKLRCCPFNFSSLSKQYQMCEGFQHLWTKLPHSSLGHTHTFSPTKINLQVIDVALFSCRHFRPPHGQGKHFVSRRSLLE